MDCIFDAVTAFFSERFPDFLSHEDGSDAIIFDNSKVVNKRYLDGGCEYTLNFKLTFRDYFGRDPIKNAANRRKQEHIAKQVISGPLPALPNGAEALTLDISEISCDCIDVRSETARYCVGCRLIFLAEGHYDNYDNQ